MRIGNVKKVNRTANQAASDLDRIMKNPEDPLIALGFLTKDDKEDDKIQREAIVYVKGDIVKLTKVFVALAKRDPVFVGKFLRLLKAVIAVIDDEFGEPNG